MASLRQPGQQAVEQHHVGTAAQRQVQVGILAGGGATRVDHHQPGAAPGAGCPDALHQHRLAPRQVRAGQHDQVSLFQVGVIHRHHILAEGPQVPRHGRGHAQPRIGVDVGGADEAFGQLVGNVVVLGQQLAGDIQRHRVRPVAGNAGRQAGGHLAQGFVPARGGPLNYGFEQPSLEPQRRGQRRALGTQPAAVGGMVRIAAHADGTITGALRQHAATHAAVGTGGARDVGTHAGSPSSRDSRSADTSRCVWISSASCAAHTRACSHNGATRP